MMHISWRLGYWTVVFPEKVTPLGLVLLMNAEVVVFEATDMPESVVVPLPKSKYIACLVGW